MLIILESLFAPRHTLYPILTFKEKQHPHQRTFLQGTMLKGSSQWNGLEHKTNRRVVYFCATSC